MDLLTQAYQNNWPLYEQALRRSPSLPHWDLCVLTAANERQARAYEMQLEERWEMGVLPPNTRWIVVPDVGGVRIGSGGATLHVLLEVMRTLEPDSEPGEDPVGEAARILQGRRVLVIHSGGIASACRIIRPLGNCLRACPTSYRMVGHLRCSTSLWCR